MNKIGAILTWFEIPEASSKPGESYNDRMRQRTNHARVYYGDRAECVTEANDYARKYLAGGLIYGIKVTPNQSLDGTRTIESVKRPKQY